MLVDRCLWTLFLTSCFLIALCDHSAGQSSEAAAGSSTVTEDPATQPITEVLTQQAQAWNAGDLEGYMQHYWQSDQLSFCSGGKRTYGWTQVLTRYRQKYDTPEAMGKLTFSNLEIRSLIDSVALVIGEWLLERDTDELSGNFSLVLQQMDGRWVIVHDHTSLRE